MNRTMGMAVALWIGMAATTAQATTPPGCLTHAEANALFTAVLPDMIDGIGKSCMTALPENATLRAGLPPLVASYRAQADAAWPDAMKVFGKMAGTDLKGMDPKLIRAMMGPMLAATIAKDIKPADCPTIDRAFTLLSPLPPANVSELVVLLAETGMKGKKDAPFAICKAEAVDTSAPIAPRK